MTKSPDFISVNAMENVIGHVRDIVMMFRRRGVKTEHAIPEVAELLDLTPKRVKSIFYRDGLWKMARDEADEIERRFVRHLDREIMLSIEYTENLRVKRNQISMGLSECENRHYSPRGSGFGSIALRAASGA